MRHVSVVGLAFLFFSGCGSDEDINRDPSDAQGDHDSVTDQGGDGDDDDDDGSTKSSVPTAPLTFKAGDVLTMKTDDVTSYVMVPRAYDATHATPAQVFIYLHGCGGKSSDDVRAASNVDARWIGLAPGGAEGVCWDKDRSKSAAIVMSALANLKSHFNVDPKRVHIGGYSSGGDLSYYTALHNASAFAGVLSYNSIPAYGAGELTTSIAGATWKLNIAHLSHTADDSYPIADVRARMKQLKDAGFPATLIERPGTHYDANTTNDRNTLIYPYLDAGWRAP